MTILDINEILGYGITEQPTEYNSEEELIKWLKYDLLQQANNKGKIANKNNIIIIADKEEYDYTLNIGKEMNIFETIINFDFNFISIMNSIKNVYNNNCEIYYIINSCNVIFHMNVYFYNCIFHNKIYFSYSKFKNYTIFSSIIFNNILYFLTTECNQIDFVDIKFSNKAKFAYSIFNHINMQQISFYDLIDFYSSRFINKFIFNVNIYNDIEIIFYYSIFEEDSYFTINNIHNNCFYKVKFDFSLIEINKNIIFENIKIDSLILDHLKFLNNDSSLSILNNINDYNEINNISLQNINICGRLYIYNTKVNIIDFKASVINGGFINPVNFKVDKFANRESALFLKNEAYARNNAIDALEYKAKEIECHKDDLMKSAKDIIQNKEYSFSKKIKELYKIVGDIASIYLSSLYSDNGQNWIKALFMTIFITIICFTVFYIPDLTKANIIRLYYKNLFPELIKYFIPTDYSLIIKYAASKLNLFLKIFGVLVYFLGKVLFWYGSVQTVQAFRKFAKGA
ncbi:hypothetical protein [Brachyspira hyodysenteriae]|uniref:Uncharacterized protein n=2 Tax=Brachyspira hyodysenteriae TaxID=159 RepID=A0A3B6VDR6_BRAHW|nr:hypothetical protein [Brachyspira hyodysenteriae]ACN84393.1 hypothetical protein BHWA1_01930 [Brachyspira hyodysenteriae WA1]AUJ50123.1 hypothetical protein BH718_01687 [Brachyspira hyodysenteriae]KLI28541.1 hypothetical protein SZ49_13390 [Brachyspira hyodysenteriae]KLI30029.1 hypothetical protein SZ50_13020 [Brachyspira hyodysenteriae]KLI45047.1 hypothetical protein SZ53_02145 [Brachyspira hyodysenteriae]